MKHLLLYLLLALPLFSQGPPDCKVNFSFTTTGRQPTNGFTNGTPTEPGCVTWTIVYYSTGFSALSLRLDSAPDATGVAGAWISFSGTLVAGVNPNTTTTQNFTVITGYNPWVSINLTSVTGTGRISGTAYGWKNPGFTYTSTAGGGPSANVNLVQVGGVAVALGQAAMGSSIPVVIASDQSNLPENLKQINGTTVDANTGNASAGTQRVVLATNQPAIPVTTSGGCTLQAEVALSGTGYIQIVAASGSTVIKVCNIVWTSSSAGTPTVNTFTVAFGVCAGAPTEALNVAGVTGYTDGFGGTLAGAASAAMCAKESTANADKVTVTYSQL